MRGHFTRQGNRRLWPCDLTMRFGSERGARYFLRFCQQSLPSRTRASRTLSVRPMRSRLRRLQGNWLVRVTATNRQAVLLKQAAEIIRMNRRLA